MELCLKTGAVRPAAIDLTLVDRPAIPRRAGTPALWMDRMRSPVEPSEDGTRY